MPSFPDIAAILGEGLRELDCRGLLCAVERGGVLRTFSAGTIPPADQGRPFYVYSITKTFTAVAVLRLFEERGLSLDARVAEWLPEPPLPEGVTVRRLLNHTGGLSDYFFKAEYGAAVRAHPETPWPRARLMAFGLEGTPRFAPGEGWSYSNCGYTLLNEVIERISGTVWHAYVKETILDPLGLTGTRPFLEPDREGLLLKGEEPSISGDFRMRYAPGWIAPGCLISTVAEVARFYRELLTGNVLSPSALTAMKETVDVPVSSPVPMIPAYGLGVMHGRNHPLGPSYGHGGGGPGYATYAACYPDLAGEPLSFALVVNRSLPSTPFALADRIAGAFV